MENKFYLVTTTKYFVDPHGSPDFAGTTKLVSDILEYDLGFSFQEWNENKGKYKQYDRWVDDPDSDEDGYNSTCESFDIKEITPEQAENYKNIINAYESL